ncbi:hypothetical protein [Micromonospora thermarum]|uniref:Uncharacterized protein n=1 Tax=Micromonospora thermarum TaxID=2720024 RepID=A0ABX0ZG18_9ACTN|nr:hypothetical protein [Micromonospora thermarum]NJP35894.1 hypothetical protein [Micromonospora thermarum]
MPKSTPSRRRPARTISLPERGDSPHIPRQAKPVDDEAAENDTYLLTPRDLLILMITLIVGLLAAIVAGLTTAVQAAPAIGLGPAVALGIASGLVTLVVTGLLVAHKLHKLVR